MNIKHLLKCEITFRTIGSENQIISGLLRSTFDAYMQTLNSVNQLCYAKVRVL